MVYRKRTTKKTYKRRYTRRPGAGWMNMASKAFKLAKHVAGLVNAEAKDSYEVVGLGALNFNGVQHSINGAIVQGVADGERTGDSIKLKTLTVRGDLTRNGADDIVRILIVWDKQGNSTPANLLQFIGNNQVVNSPKNDDQYYNTKILYDKNFVISSNIPKRQFKIVVPINAHTKYDNTTNLIVDGELWFFAFSQLGVAAGTLAEYTSKLTFMDN